MLSKKAKIIGVVATVGVIGTSAGVAIPLILKKSKKDKKFDFTSDLAKIQDFTSDKLKTDLNTAIGSKTAKQSVTLEQLGIKLDLSKGVTAEYKINSVYSSATGAVVIDVTLKKDKEKSTTKTITVTAKDVVFAADLSRIVTAVSSKNKVQLNALSLNKDAEKSAMDLGITEPPFSSGVSAKYKVKTAYNNTNGKVTLTVTLTDATGISVTKDLIVVASDSEWGVNLAKIVNAVSSKTKSDLKTAVNNLKKDQTTSAANLGYDVPSGITQSQLTFTVKEAYKEATGKVTVTVTWTKNSKKITKDITISASDAEFDYDKDLAKIVNAVSSKAKTKLSSDIGTLNINKSVKASQLGYTLPTLSSGVLARYSIKEKYDSSKGKVKIVVTLSKAWEKIVEKEITIIAKDVKKFDYTNDLWKIMSVVSTKAKSVMKSDLSSKEMDAAVTKENLGISQSFSQGVSATYKVKTKYNDTKGKIVVIATLSKDEEISVTKEFAVIASDSVLAMDLTKIMSVVSTKAKSVMKSDLSSKEMDAAVTKDDLGITESFSTNVSATYKVKTKYNNSKGKIVVIATLSKGEELSVTKEFAVIASDSVLGTKLAEYKTGTSTKNKDDLNGLVSLQTVGNSTNTAELGIATVSLDSKLTATLKVKTVYNSSTGKVVVTVTLTDGTISVSKDITITAKVVSGS